jgi:serine acetyltransferase
VNRDIPADALVVGVPAHLLRMLNMPVEQDKDEKE